jgi:hypothetical protein
MVKRNDVVYSKHDTMYAAYGRVNRILPDGRVETIDSGQYIRVQEASDLVVVDYKGRWEWTSHSDDEGNAIKIYYEQDGKGNHDWKRIKYVRPVRWCPMPTLRRLKQNAARYDKTVWKKNRKGLYCEETRFMEPYGKETDCCASS